MSHNRKILVAHIAYIQSISATLKMKNSWSWSRSPPKNLIHYYVSQGLTVPKVLQKFIYNFLSNANKWTQNNLIGQDKERKQVNLVSCTEATNQSRSSRFVFKSICCSSRCFSSCINTSNLASWILVNTKHSAPCHPGVLQQSLLVTMTYLCYLATDHVHKLMLQNLPVPLVSRIQL